MIYLTENIKLNNFFTDTIINQFRKAGNLCLKFLNT